MGNLADLVRTAAERSPDTEALVFSGEFSKDSSADAAPPRTVSWAQLDSDVDAAAAGLRDLGHGEGERIALVLSNTPTFVTAYFGALRAGLVVVPVNPGYTSAEIAWLLDDSGTSLVVCEGATEHVVEEAVAGTSRVVLTTGAPFDAVLADGRARGLAVTTRGGEDLAVLLYTSGTSGRPKGAMLTHRALRANLDQCAALDPAPLAPDDRVLLVLPLFHVYGLNGVLGMAARQAATVVLADRFDPAETLALVRRERVTNIAGAPPMWVAWAERADLGEALADVRTMVSGAAPLPPAVLEQVRTAVGRPVFEGYGLTETAPVVTTTLGSARVKPGSVGRPLPGVEVRLVDEVGDEVADDDAGELLVRGPNLFSGYWPDGSGGPDPEGWFATGDVAYADDDGDLFLVDRRKELVLVSGFNVYPREVEEVLETHPAIAEAAVIAVPHPQTGEAVKAFVVPRAGVTLTSGDVVAHARTRLARFKAPTIVEIVETLPHSATGKVAKGRLRAAERAS